MRDILKNIEGTDRLAQLFNAYLKGLSTPSIMCDPCYTTMAEVRAFDQDAMKPKHRKHHKHSVKNFYNLTVLSNSLHHIHKHVLGAIEELETFFASYGESFLDYAADKRVKCLLENGSQNDEEALTDWYRENEADETEEWKAVRKTDPESLKHYSLHSEMGWHFGGDDTGRGEYIGTSSPLDFEPYSTLVANQSAFSFRRFMEHFGNGKVGAISKMQPDGTMVPMSLGDQVEHEINQDLRGEGTVLFFNTALGLCSLMRERYCAMQPEDLQAFRTMHRYLQMVRDVDFPDDFLQAVVTGQIA